MESSEALLARHQGEDLGAVALQLPGTDPRDSSQLQQGAGTSLDDRRERRVVEDDIRWDAVRACSCAAPSLQGIEDRTGLCFRLGGSRLRPDADRPPIREADLVEKRAAPSFV